MRAIGLFLFLAMPILAAPATYLVFVGTYTNGNSASKGIYAYRFHPSSGEIDSLGLAAETPSPSFLAVHPNRRFLYAVNESNASTVSAFAIDSKTGKLTALNQVSSRVAGRAILRWTKPARNCWWPTTVRGA